MAAAQVQKWGVLYNADALTIDDMLHFASLADAAGADSVWTAEGWRDAFVPLAAIAAVASVHPETLSFWNRWLNSDF